MDGVVGPIKAYLKKRDPATIDNFAFKLHYRVTFVVMLVCMMLVSARQYIGDPISCIADGVPGGTLDLYCWIHSTFSVPSRWGGLADEYGEGAPHTAGRAQPHPGIAPPVAGEDVVRTERAAHCSCVITIIFISGPSPLLPVGCVCPVHPGRRVPPSQDRVEARGGRSDEDAGGGPDQPPDAH